MSVKPKVQVALILVLSLITIIATGFALQQHVALSALRRATASGDDPLDRASLESRLADAEHRARALENELAELRSKSTTNNTASDEPPPPPPGEESAQGRGDFGPRRGREAAMALMESPEFVQLMRTQQLGMLDSRYADLFKKLVSSGKISPQQLQTFKDLLIEQQNTMRDVMMTARQQGIRDRDQLDALVKSAQTDMEAQIQSTLGNEAYAQYQQYTQTASQRAVVSRIENSLSYSGSPLSDAQAEQLVSALYAASGGSSSQNTNQPAFRGPMGGNNVRITDSMVAAAQNVLSPAQMEAVVALQKQQQAERQMMQMMREARQSGAASAPKK